MTLHRSARPVLRAHALLRAFRPALALLVALGAPGDAWARTSVVVLRSDDLPAYDAPIDAFSRELGRPVQVYDLKGEKSVAQRIVSGLRDDPPPLVLALGAKAAYSAVHELPGVPLVYAMVYDPARYGIEGAGVTGVSMQVPPDMVLSQLQVFAPKVRRIGIIVSTLNTDPGVAASIEAARAANYKVVARRVGDAGDVRHAFGVLRKQVDAIWLLPDARVVTPSNFQFIRAEADRARLPLLAWSEGLVLAGALMCVAPDQAEVGAQAAELALRILGGENPGAIEPEAPNATRVVLNRDVQESLGLRVDPALLDFVDQVVHAPTER